MKGFRYHGQIAVGDARMDVTTEMVGAILVVRAAGRLDSVTAETFDARLQEVAIEGDTHVVLDLAQVSYVASAGLRSLLLLMKRVKANGGALVLAAVHPRVQDILDIAGFTTMFAIVPTVDDGLARLQPGR